MPLPFPLFVQRDLRRTHSACQQQPHPKGPSGCRHRSVAESIITQYMIGPMYSLPVEHEARRQTAESQQRSGPLTDVRLSAAGPAGMRLIEKTPWQLNAT